MIERDLMTGLMAMSMGVAYPACIAAEMIVRGDITRKGVLSTMRLLLDARQLKTLSWDVIFIGYYKVRHLMRPCIKT